MRIQPTRHSTLRSIEVNTMVLLFIAFLTLAACANASQPSDSEGGGIAYTEGVPGGVMVDTVDMSAKVAAVDTADRKLTLIGPDGNKVTVKVGPEAVNFDQIRVGDMVNATVTEQLVVFLGGEGTSAPDGSSATVALAPKGARPGGLMAETTQTTATITAIDPTNRTATLKFEDGSSQTFAVRDDIDLDQRKVGEKMVFQVTEMIAISVEKP